ncbi:MAG: protein-export chaperone SecB [Gammaproteobacteria bacterium]|nr:protein-export chaperone SecB [Gammaproteobacteria bacterium]
MAEKKATETQFLIQKLYVKDVSFESPNSPGTFTYDAWQPNVDLQLQSQNKRISDDAFEVVLSITVTVKQKEETAFLIEVQQAGIFTITGIEGDQLAQLLGSHCLNIMFPYAREVISDLVTKGGFPSLLLSPINFDSMYAEHLRKQQEIAENASTETAH